MGQRGWSGCLVLVCAELSKQKLCFVATVNMQRTECGSSNDGNNNNNNKSRSSSNNLTLIGVSVQCVALPQRASFGMLLCVCVCESVCVWAG